MQIKDGYDRQVRWMRTHPPQLVKRNKIKNTDTAHNSPCVEERSTFLHKKTIFHFF